MAAATAVPPMDDTTKAPSGAGRPGSALATAQFQPVAVTTSPYGYTTPATTTGVASGVAQDNMELFRARLVLFAKVQLVLGVLMIPLSWSWVSAALALSSAAVILTHLGTSERCGSFFAARGMRDPTLASCGCEPGHLRGLNLAGGIISAISTFSFIIAAATLGHWYIVTADAWTQVEQAAGSSYVSNYSSGWAAGLRYQAAMLVFGVLFSLAQTVLAAGVYKTYTQLHEAARVVYPSMPAVQPIYIIAPTATAANGPQTAMVATAPTVTVQQAVKLPEATV